MSSVSDNNFQEIKREDKSAICKKRDSIRFCYRIFPQTFDLPEENISVYFAGKSGADAVGPMKGFLDLCMKNMQLIANMFFANQDDIFFKLSRKCKMKKNYYILGQLAGFAICNIGRGPEFFHQFVVKALFSKDVFQSNSIPEIDHLERKSVSKKKKK